MSPIDYVMTIAVSFTFGVVIGVIAATAYWGE